MAIITHGDASTPDPKIPGKVPDKCPRCGTDKSQFEEEYGIGFGGCGLQFFCTCGQLVAMQQDAGD